jgi:hypothetical protein
VQKSRVSRLANLQPKPHTVPLSPRLPNQLSPIRIQRLLGPFHGGMLRLHGSRVEAMEHPAAGQHGERLTKPGIKPLNRLAHFGDKVGL